MVASPVEDSEGIVAHHGVAAYSVRLRHWEIWHKVCRMVEKGSSQPEKADSSSKSRADSSTADRRARARKAARDDAETRIGWRMAGLGFEVAAQVAAGALLGWLYDRYIGHGTSGILVGAILGLAVAMWTLIRGSLKLNRELDKQAPLRGRGEPITPEEWSKDDWKRDDWNNTDDLWKDDEDGNATNPDDPR